MYVFLEKELKALNKLHQSFEYTFLETSRWNQLYNVSKINILYILIFFYYSYRYLFGRYLLRWNFGLLGLAETCYGSSDKRKLFHVSVIW